MALNCSQLSLKRERHPCVAERLWVIEYCLTGFQNNFFFFRHIFISETK